MDRPDASEFAPINKILNEPGDYVHFRQTDAEKDAGQTSIPYLDIQDVITTPPSPMVGIGMYYKGMEGFGGFIGLKGFGYYRNEIIQPDKLEEYFNQINATLDKIQP